MSDVFLFLFREKTDFPIKKNKFLGNAPKEKQHFQKNARF